MTGRLIHNGTAFFHEWAPIGLYLFVTLLGIFHLHHVLPTSIAFLLSFVLGCTVAVLTIFFSSQYMGSLLGFEPAFYRPTRYTSLLTLTLITTLSGTLVALPYWLYTGHIVIVNWLFLGSLFLAFHLLGILVEPLLLLHLHRKEVDADVIKYRDLDELVDE